MFHSPLVDDTKLIFVGYLDFPKIKKLIKILLMSERAQNRKTLYRYCKQNSRYSKAVYCFLKIAIITVLVTGESRVSRFPPDFLTLITGEFF